MQLRALLRRNPELRPVAKVSGAFEIRLTPGGFSGLTRVICGQQLSVASARAIWGRFAELPGPAIVVYQDLDDPCVAATFGEIMCSTYQAFGAAGLITSGAARDLDQVRRIGFPAFSNGAICSHGYSHIVDIHRAVRVGGVTVQPGDLLHADANGVTTIPLDIAPEIADAADEYVKAESIVLDYLKAGKPEAKAFGEARKAMLTEIAALGRRVRAGKQSAAGN